MFFEKYFSKKYCSIDIFFDQKFFDDFFFDHIFRSKKLLRFQKSHLENYAMRPGAPSSTQCFFSDVWTSGIIFSLHRGKFSEALHVRIFSRCKDFFPDVRFFPPMLGFFSQARFFLSAAVIPSGVF